MATGRHADIFIPKMRDAKPPEDAKEDHKAEKDLIDEFDEFDFDLS